RVLLATVGAGPNQIGRSVRGRAVVERVGSAVAHTVVVAPGTRVVAGRIQTRRWTENRPGQVGRGHARQIDVGPMAESVRAALARRTRAGVTARKPVDEVRIEATADECGEPEQNPHRA